MNHPIINDLKNRYTAKRYDETKRIPPQELEVIYEALRLSASSINSQPWKFIVIESEQAKKRMDATFANKFQFNQPHVMSASHIILFAHNPAYTKSDYAKVVDQGIADGRVKPEDRDSAFAAFAFAELNTDDNGSNEAWTKAQTYIALGNAFHVLARLNIDSTPMEGIDTELVKEMFAKELDGYQCDVALAIGYHHPTEDYNAALPKSRLPHEEVVTVI